MPKEINLSSSLDRLVCKELVSRRKYPILDVIEALNILGQPHLLVLEESEAHLHATTAISQSILNKIVAPISSTK